MRAPPRANAGLGLSLAASPDARRRAGAGLDAYVLNARASELGTGVGPALREELLFAQAVRRAEAQAKAAAAAAPPRNAE